MLSADLADLYRHMRWADSEVWRSVRASPAAKDDRKLRELLLHLHVVQRAFLLIWRGDALEFPSLDSFETVEALEQWSLSYHDEVTSFLDSLDERMLDSEVHLPWSEELGKRFGTVHPVTLRETLMQVTAHSTYHRGQVNMRLRELGGEPPLVDYIAWLWYGRPVEV